MTPLSQKAHDISFAVFRVATLIKNNKLRRELEDAATDLIARYEDAANPSIKYHVADPIDRLDRLVAIAESTKEMKTVNSQVLRRELNNLQTAIGAVSSGSSDDGVHANGNIEDINIEDMFPSVENTEDAIGASVQGLGASESKLNPKPYNTLTHTISDRQTAILAAIRGIQFCRLRNIMDKMPQISERTIRNDIQMLISTGLVQRIGGGGPASYFQTMEVMARA